MQSELTKASQFLKLKDVSVRTTCCNQEKGLLLVFDFISLTDKALFVLFSHVLEELIVPKEALATKLA